ncbi:Retrovirus-related Pol polyprotein, partial [Mucuna pruriens]
MDSLDTCKSILHLKINTRIPSLVHSTPSHTHACRLAYAMLRRCMTNIFSDLLQDCMKVFMDDFMKCHFMVTEGIMLGHLVSSRGIDVDKSKIDTSLPNLAFVREVRLFLGHAGFYRRFIKNFSNIALPLSKCIETFQKLKIQLTSTPILQAPKWEYPFELMCDASNSTLGAVFGQQVRAGNQSHVIAYASQTMDSAQLNYITTEKELFAIVFAFDKFEFDIEIRDKRGAENSVVGHLSRIERESDSMPI